MSDEHIVYEDLVFMRDNYRVPEPLMWWQLMRRFQRWRTARRFERLLREVWK